MTTPDAAAPSLRGVALAAGSGALATIALLLGPVGASIPPIVPPYVPIDLRLLVAPIAFVGAYLFGTVLTWPGPAISLPGTAVATAVGAHLHASAALDFLGVPWAAPGTRVGLIALAASLGSILLALHHSLTVAAARTASDLDRRGVPQDEIATARQLAGEVRRSALITAGVGISVLALALRIVDGLTGGGALPLPEIFALAVVLGVGAILLGVHGREETVPGP